MTIFIRKPWKSPRSSVHHTCSLCHWVTVQRAIPKPTSTFNVLNLLRFLTSILFTHRVIMLLVYKSQEVSPTCLYSQIRQVVISISTFHAPGFRVMSMCNCTTVPEDWFMSNHLD